MNNIKQMLGKRQPEYYLLITWCITCPVLLLLLFISRLIDESNQIPSDGNYQFPRWTLYFGWALLTICTISIPVYYLYQYIQSYNYVSIHPNGKVNK
jgi:hypothetical protein